MRKDFLVFGSPRIEQDEIDEVVASLRSGWISTGPKVARFEALFRDYTGARHDVLEHIEPEHLEEVLDDIRRCAKKVVFLTIATRPAVKTLPDGRNAHLIQQDLKWWLPKLWDRFTLMSIHNMGGQELWICCG